MRRQEEKGRGCTKAINGYNSNMKKDLVKYLDDTILTYLLFQVISESFESATVLYAEFIGIDEHISDISANEVNYIFEL